MVDYGVDLQWTNDASLTTVKNEDNVLQHIKNRLQTNYEELDWVYDNYGCNYKQYLGLKANSESLEFIKNSITQSLKEDEFIDDFDLSLSYIGNGVINIVLNINGEYFDFNIGGEE